MKTYLKSLLVMFGVIAAVLAGTTINVWGGVVLPTLDWWDEGRTFYYDWSDGSEVRLFNATITTVTSSNVEFTYWDWDDIVNDWRNRSKETYGKDNRSILGAPGYSTPIWVNATNVESEEARIGNKTYARTDIDLVNELVKFGDGDYHFTYDLVKGWIVKAVFDQEGITTTLTDTGFDTVPPAWDD